jgi:hypothetical protein
MNAQVAFNIVSTSVLLKQYLDEMCMYTCLQTEVYVVCNISYTLTLNLI